MGEEKNKVKKYLTVDQLKSWLKVALLLVVLLSAMLLWNISELKKYRQISSSTYYTYSQCADLADNGNFEKQQPFMGLNFTLGGALNETNSSIQSTS